MKHTLKITLILLILFFLAQLVGLAVLQHYSPSSIQVTINGTSQNITSYNLPYGFEPPQGIQPEVSLISIIIAFVIAISIVLLLMKFKSEIFLRIWFFIVIIIALSITLSAFLSPLKEAGILALLFALVLAYLKVFRRDIFVHNITEILIYPGIAALFVPLLSIPTTVLLLGIISLYDIYAVWHAKFMQKMAKYQLSAVKVFSGFLIPYLSKKDRLLLSKSKKSKKVKISLAILGGGDVVFPLFLEGVVLHTLGFIPAFIVALGATISLAFLLYNSEKGKFYPAMPFITIGCLIALVIAFLI